VAGAVTVASVPDERGPPLNALTGKTTEGIRLAKDRRTWLRWGPYVSERSWGTVREDYSSGGTAWEYFPHDHARSRAYRWSEDGLGGICDQQQTVCVAFAFWNGRDPILKERIFGLTGNQGNHGEDAKELWWYLDSTPTHSWMRWRYLYPIGPFPYDDLVASNASRGRDDAEYELFDTGALDAGYWEITADYAKADHDDLCIRLSVRNMSTETAIIEVLPTVWCRNTWSWDYDQPRPRIAGAGDSAVISIDHPVSGQWHLTSSGQPTALFCDNDTNTRRLWGVDGAAYPKDAINDRVVGAESCNPDHIGTKAAFWHNLTVASGETTSIYVRLSAASGDSRPADAAVLEPILAERLAEADAYYATLGAADATDDQRRVMRQAFAGMLWSKQFYHFDVERWLEGDPAQPAPPPGRSASRNAAWRHLNNADVISMPDKWEYPWFAAWDLAFHCVAIAHVDPIFAKEQLLLLCREWYQHPSGQLPAYEWAFGDVNPPVHAWAARKVFEIDGGTDHQFLERVFHKLLLNFTWWVNRKDSEGNNVFEGGFLGLDNIGPIDRSASLKSGTHLEQSDGTAWMGMYCLNLLDISLVLARNDRSYEDMATKFFEHFAYIARAIHDAALWDDDDGFYYDMLHFADGHHEPLRVRSVVGLLPLAAATFLPASSFDALPDFATRFRWFRQHRPQYSDYITHSHDTATEGELLAIVDAARLIRILVRLLDTSAFLSPHGIRALSAEHRDHPFTLELDGQFSTVDYEPGESRSGLFGGNSNWRGPIWFPVNYILIEAIARYGSFLGPEFLVEFPTGSGNRLPLCDIADDLSARLVGIFLDDASGRRPCFGTNERLQNDIHLHDLIPFNEYFHGDTGAGLGASHQTGWTGLVAAILADRGGQSIG
jgi:hypothetical protein